MAENLLTEFFEFRRQETKVLLEMNKIFNEIINDIIIFKILIIFFILIQSHYQDQFNGISAVSVSINNLVSKNKNN